MPITITTKLIRIGNSQGIRLSKLLIELSGLSGDVEVEAQESLLLIRRPKRMRQNWEEKFAAMAASGDDNLLDGDTYPPTEWEETDWEL